MDRSMGGKANEIIIYTNLWLLFQYKIKKSWFSDFTANYQKLSLKNEKKKRKNNFRNINES